MAEFSRLSDRTKAALAFFNASKTFNNVRWQAADARMS
jgi:hypothetical protein